jgi:hypothetical protein
MASMPVDTCEQHNSPEAVAGHYGITTPVALRRSRAHPERERCVVCRQPATRAYSMRWQA